MPSDGRQLSAACGRLRSGFRHGQQRLAGLLGVGLILLSASCAQPATPVAVVARDTATPAPATASASPSALPTATLTSTPTSTPSATATATNTATPEPTATATSSATPTASATRTATRRPVVPTITPTLPPPTPQPPAQPGLYPQSVPCATYVSFFSKGYTAPQPGVVSSTATISWCIISVVIKPQTGNMEFNVSWSGMRITGEEFSYIPSGLGGGYYLMDDQGERYDHIAENGAALVGGNLDLRTGKPTDGTFVFPPATDGARTFTFHDADDQVALSNITLNGTPQSP